MEIPEPPNVVACASCASALTWLYSPRKSCWTAFTRYPGDPLGLRAHRCDPAERDASYDRTWRDLPVPSNPAAAEAARADARKVVDEAARRTARGAPCPTLPTLPTHSPTPPT